MLGLLLRNLANKCLLNYGKRLAAKNIFPQNWKLLSKHLPESAGIAR